MLSEGGAQRIILGHLKSKVSICLNAFFQTASLRSVHPLRQALRAPLVEPAESSQQLANGQMPLEKDAHLHKPNFIL